MNDQKTFPRGKHLNGEDSLSGAIEDMAAPWFAHSFDLKKLGEAVIKANNEVTALPRKQERDFIKLVGVQFIYVNALAANGNDNVELTLAMNAFEAFLYGRHFRLALQLETTKFNRWPRRLVGMMLPLFNDMMDGIRDSKGLPEADGPALNGCQASEPALGRMSSPVNNGCHDS